MGLLDKLWLWPGPWLAPSGGLVLGKWLGTRNYGENGGRGSKNGEKGSLTKQPQTSKYPPPRPQINALRVLCVSVLKDKGKGRCSRNWV